MNEIKLLIIEDDKDFRDSYSKQIKLFNADNAEVNIIEIFAADVETAKAKLKEGFIDAAIVDMKLGNADVEYVGNELINIIKSNLRFPVFIVTANPEKIEEESENENDLFKIRVKGSAAGNFTSILEELVKIYNTGVTRILGKTGQIEKYLNEIFWKHLSNSINLWVSDTTRTNQQKEQSLLRYTLSHIQEYLDLNEGGNLSNYHPAEFYISLPVKPSIFTGDIIELTEGNQKAKYVILTPACDIDKKNGIRKAEKILLLRIRDWKTIDPGFSLSPLSSGKKAELKECMRNSRPRFHYTPKTNRINGGFIDFQEKLTIDSIIIEQKLISKEITRVATISSPFLKDIISRYSSYYSRQGSPDFNTDEIFAALVV